MLFGLIWRGGRVVDGARLERVFRVKPNVGSNPTLSAIDVGVDDKCRLLVQK